MKVLVTGANGFVGKNLIESLLKKGYHVTALVRSMELGITKHDQITWVVGDLHYPETLPPVHDIDKSFYLVHGLKGSEHDFEYEESSAAVNFINWIRPTNSGIIYLGALGTDEEKLSPHLRSRHLTGAILGASGLGLIEFRASIILGEGSLSFEMIKAISERFPFRPQVSLLNQLCQPLALEDLLLYLEDAIKLPDGGHKIFEIGGPETATYGELIDLYCELAGLKRKKLKIPEVEMKVLAKTLDYSLPEYSRPGVKLAESLEHPTVVTNDLAVKVFPDIKTMDLRLAMDKARLCSKTHYAPLWEKSYLRSLLSDKILTQSGVLSPDLLRNLEKIGKLREIFSRK